MTFGEKIQSLRKQSGLSQEELSYRLGVSRQAVSKWERNSGYPETEKLIKMSKLFNVTIDYLLGENNSSVWQEKNGIYVSMKDVNGFLSFQKLKYRKIGAAAGILTASFSLAFISFESNMIIFMTFVIVGAVLFISAKISGDRYRELNKKTLYFDQEVREKLLVEFDRKDKFMQMLILTGMAFIAAGVLVFPLMSVIDKYISDDVIFASGMILAGAGVYLCVSVWGVIKSYRLLIMNEKGQEEF